MHAYDARQLFIDGLEQYIAGIETDDGLLRLSENVCTYHDPLPQEARKVVMTIVGDTNETLGTYEAAARAIHLRLTGKTPVDGQKAA